MIGNYPGDPITDGLAQRLTGGPGERTHKGVEVKVTSAKEALYALSTLYAVLHEAYGMPGDIPGLQELCKRQINDVSGYLRSRGENGMVYVSPQVDHSDSFPGYHCRLMLNGYPSYCREVITTWDLQELRYNDDC